MEEQQEKARQEAPAPGISIARVTRAMTRLEPQEGEGGLVELSAAEVLEDARVIVGEYRRVREWLTWIVAKSRVARLAAPPARLLEQMDAKLAYETGVNVGYEVVEQDAMAALEGELPPDWAEDGSEAGQKD